MTEEVKKQQGVRVKKPQADWKKFVHEVLTNYGHKKQLLWGWVLYDWIVDNGHLPEGNFKPTNLTREKSTAMDELIANKILTIEQLKTILANSA